jgi:hypothetical protein
MTQVLPHLPQPDDNELPDVQTGETGPSTYLEILKREAAGIRGGRRPTPIDQSTTPDEFPQVPPRDLHPTSDIRFVMVEVAKLSTLVERLIADVGAREKKIDDLRHQATYIKGGLGVAVIGMGLLGWFVSQVVDGKWQAVMNALAATHK